MHHGFARYSAMFVPNLFPSFVHQPYVADAAVTAVFEVRLAQELNSEKLGKALDEALKELETEVPAAE
jgi:hypothetical protein